MLFIFPSTLITGFTSDFDTWQPANDIERDAPAKVARFFREQEERDVIKQEIAAKAKSTCRDSESDTEDDDDDDDDDNDHNDDDEHMHKEARLPLIEINSHKDDRRLDRKDCMFYASKRPCHALQEKIASTVIAFARLAPQSSAKVS